MGAIREWEGVVRLRRLRDFVGSDEDRTSLTPMGSEADLMRSKLSRHKTHIRAMMLKNVRLSRPYGR
jgi:hypothetical protein